MLKERVAESCDDLKNKSIQLQARAQTVVWVAVEGKVIGMLGIADPIKESFLQAIEALHQMGIKVVMLTGDNHKTAEAMVPKN